MPGAPPFQVVVVCENKFVLKTRIRAKELMQVVEQNDFFMSFIFEMYLGQNSIPVFFFGLRCRIGAAF